MESRLKDDSIMKKQLLIFIPIAVVLLIAWNTARVSCFYMLLMPDRPSLYYFMSGLTLLIIALAFIAAWFLVLKKRRGEEIKLERFFFICVLTLGVFYSMILIPTCAPDELQHFANAYCWSNVLLGQEPVDENGNVYMREEDSIYYNQYTCTPEHYYMIYGQIFSSEENDVIVSSDQTTTESSFLPYIPQILGVTIGRLLHRSYAMTIYLARMLNLLFFVICVCFALRKMPFGKPVLFVISVLPMTLHLSSSLSYDSFVMGIAMLFIASCMDAIFVKEKVTWKDMVLLTVLLGLLAPCKIIYSFLAIMLFFIPREKFSSGGARLISAVVVVAVMLICIYLFYFSSVFSFAVNDGSTLVWNGEAGYAVSDLIADPLNTLQILFNTLRVNFSYYWEIMIGSQMAELNMNVSHMFIYGLSALLFGAALLDEKRDHYFKNSHRIWMIIICIVVLFLAMLSMLVAWTPISYNYVTGMQGRYLLPTLPLLLLAMKNNKIKIGRNYEYVIYSAAVLINALILLQIATIGIVGTYFS